MFSTIFVGFSSGYSQNIIYGPVKIQIGLYIKFVHLFVHTQAR